MIELPGNVKTILETFNSNAHDAYIVGGCVRDAVLGRIPNDWDITTSARPAEIKKLFRRTVDTGIEHGTVTVLMGDESYEVTTYRIDGDYSDNRHPDEVIFTDDLREDLRRRDFTINAMAYNPERGLVDEFGGQEDLKNGIIRAVGNADERFSEDALRILRAVRFAAQLGFTIEESTREAIRKHAPELTHVSEERIFTEINKTLESPNPKMMTLIFDTGMADFICDGFGRITRDAAENLRETLPPVRHIRWADLMSNVDESDATVILKELKTDNDTLYKVTTLIRESKNLMPDTEVGIRHLLNRIGPELFDDLVLLLEASGEIIALKEKIIERGDAYNLKMLALTGKDLIEMGYETGPAIGDVLDTLLSKVMEDPSLNEKDKLKRSLCE